MKLTPIQQEMLLYQLEMSHLIAESIAPDRVDAIIDKCDTLEEAVRAGYVPELVNLDEDYFDILEQCCVNSTYFCAERFAAPRSTSWWDRRHDAADSLEQRLYAFTGKRVKFNRVS